MKIVMTITPIDNIHKSNGEVLDDRKVVKKKFDTDEDISIFDCFLEKYKTVKAGAFIYDDYLLNLNNIKYYVLKSIIGDKFKKYKTRTKKIIYG